MPAINDHELLYALLSEGKLDLMYLPAGAIAWLWMDERPEEQVAAAARLGVSSKDINPVTDASILKSDRNILILKCENGQTFRVYPSGGYSESGGNMMSLADCIQSMDNHDDGGMDIEDDMPCDETDVTIDVIAVPDDRFDHMTAPHPPEEVLTGGPATLDDLMRRADDIDEEYGDQPRSGQYYTYDELASEASRDIQAHSGEDTSDYDTSDCSMDLEGQTDCPDGGLPRGNTGRYNSKKEYSQGNGDELGESFNFSNLKKKSKINHNHLPLYVYEDTNVGSLTSFSPSEDGGFWVNGFTNKAVTNPGASHAEMVRQRPEVFDMTSDGMPSGDIRDIWQSDEYEAWLDVQDPNISPLKMGIFGSGWVRGAADHNEFVGFSGALQSIRKVKPFITKTIDDYHPDKVYFDIMSNDDVNTIKLNMKDKDDLKTLFKIIGEKAPQTTENAGGAAANSAPIGTDMYDTEDDIASGVIMQFEDKN